MLTSTYAERKALFFDIDGTLLSEVTGTVPESAQKALERALELGHLAFINTGRTLCSLPLEIKGIPFSGYLCGCGTQILYGDETLYSHTISPERRREIIACVRACRADMILEGREDCYFSSRRSRFEKVERTRRYFQQMGIGIERYLDKEEVPFDKFVCYTDGQTDKETLFQELGKDMEIIDRRDDFYEVVPKGCSKAAAIDRVLERFEIPRAQAWVFGDSNNDLSMFQCVSHTVAMKVHDPVLDPYTEFVTRSVEEDGIAFAMEYYGII